MKFDIRAVLADLEAAEIPKPSEKQLHTKWLGLHDEIDYFEIDHFGMVKKGDFYFNKDILKATCKNAEYIRDGSNFWILRPIASPAPKPVSITTQIGKNSYIPFKPKLETTPPLETEHRSCKGCIHLEKTLSKRCIGCILVLPNESDGENSVRLHYESAESKPAKLNKNHEECFDCALQDLDLYGKCKGHKQGPVCCPNFISKMVKVERYNFSGRPCSTCGWMREQVCMCTIACLNGNQWKPKKADEPVKTCANCRYNCDTCFPIVGICIDHDKWKAILLPKTESENDKAMKVLRKNKCACWFVDGKLIEECNYHATVRTGRAANGDPVSSIHHGKETKKPNVEAVKIPKCHFCGKEQTELGGVLFGPPNKEGLSRKIHACVECWGNIHTWIETTRLPMDAHSEDNKMSGGDYIKLLDEFAVGYCKNNPAKSVIRNKHMNELIGDEIITKNIAEAIVVDFVNYVGTKLNLDHGLYTGNLNNGGL